MVKEVKAMSMNQKLDITTLKKKFEHRYQNSLLMRNIHKQYIQLSRIKQKVKHHAEIAIATKSMMKIQTKSVFDNTSRPD